MKQNDTPIPRKLHRLVMRACAEMDAPPYWWDSPEHKGTNVAADWTIARAIVVGVASEAGHTRFEIDMHYVTWRNALNVWEGLSKFERHAFGVIGDVDEVEFRGQVRPEDC